MAERFLVQCMNKKKDTTSFDDTRLEIFHRKSFSLDLEKLPPTSNSIKIHIRRAYLQSYLWYHALLDHMTDLNPELYGFILSVIKCECPNVSEYPVPASNMQG